MFKLKTQEELLYDIFIEIIGKFDNEKIEKLANSLLAYVKNDV